VERDERRVTVPYPGFGPVDPEAVLVPDRESSGQAGAVVGCDHDRQLRTPIDAGTRLPASGPGASVSTRADCSRAPEGS
jgi:hypothetical protein